MDTVYLGFFYTNNEVGQYSLAKRLLLAGIALSTSLGSLLISRLANIYVLSDLQKFTDLIKLSIQFLLLIVLPASLGFAFLAPELALALGGGYYPDAVLAIYILAPCMFFVGLAHVALNQILIAKGQEKKAFLIWITGGFVSIVIGLTLVPKFGISGAAATCTLSELMVTVIALYCVRNTLKLAVSGKDCLLAVSASGLMVLAIVFSRSVFDSLPLILRTFALVVVGVLSFNSVGWPIYAKLRRTQQKLPKT